LGTHRKRGAVIMGEQAEYMLNGDDCCVCGEHIGDGDGYARTCAGCGGDEDHLDLDDDEPGLTPAERKRLKRRRYRERRRRREVIKTVQNLQDAQMENGMKYLGMLPESDKPWLLTACKGTIILLNPDHPAMMIANGKITEIKV